MQGTHWFWGFSDTQSCPLLCRHETQILSAPVLMGLNARACAVRFPGKAIELGFLIHQRISCSSFLAMGHTAAETSPKHDQPFFPCGVPQLEQLHPLQVKQWLKSSIQLLQILILDSSGAG